ncbi:glutamate--cysteine ligase, chloroplastic-like isoform X2 [Corylus avellana]|uniref:glutamate--cysteine ligase, chloroplastic-like isoform X2 n=1 Tax=Corylus avellana TaxID=13451 RepID=UPI00286A6A32|nr:glutamate--cysteine ligase, chloroplastic-like isoform X2 [Corylus avellana]
MSLLSQPGQAHFMAYGVKRNMVASNKKETHVGFPSSPHLAKTWVGRKQGHKVIVAATATEANVFPTEPLTKEDLVGYFASGCKPREEWRIGTEHEKFGFQLRTLCPITYKQIEELLNSVAAIYDWGKVMEGDNLVGLKKGKLSISLETGGQLELSGAPVKTLHETYAEIKSHLCQVKVVATKMGIGFLGIGFQPKAGLKDMPRMPKPHLEILARYFDKDGSVGIDTMCRTCTVQVNLDYSSEADMIKKFRASLALQPIATALFANSPFSEGKPNGYYSLRSHIWTANDKCRIGMLPFVFDDSFGFERYVDYALDVPMLYIYKEKKYIDCAGMSFRDFMAGKLPCLPGELPTLNDWENHLRTLYPEVRMKTFLEMRGADAGPLAMLCALPAFWVGLLYDEVSLQNVLGMIADWTVEEREMLRNKDGLERRGFKESGFLDEVAEVAKAGVTPAEKLLEMHQRKWRQCVDPLFHELLY